MPQELDPEWEYYTPDPDLFDDVVEFDENVAGYKVVFPEKRAAHRVECAGCGRLFHPLEVVSARSKRGVFYCSTSCFHANRPRWTKTCPTCGAVFETGYRQKVYCSNKCVLHKHVCQECKKVSLLNRGYTRARCAACAGRNPKKPKRG